MSRCLRLRQRWRHRAARCLPHRGWGIEPLRLPSYGVCDAAECTLREAIQAANALPNGDTPDAILFSIPACSPENPCRIELGSALPTLRDAVVLDGRSQEASTLRGLVFEGFSTAAVHLWNGSLTVLSGNFIGTDASGTLALGNKGGGLVGFDVGPCTRLGGAEPGEANVIVNNTGPNQQVEELAIDAMGYTVDGKLLVARFVPSSVSGSQGPRALVGAFDLASKQEGNCFALPSRVTDIEATDGGTALALSNGQVKFLETGETLESGLTGLVAFAQSGETRVFATSRRIKTCQRDVCTELDGKDFKDVQFPSPDLRVVLTTTYGSGNDLLPSLGPGTTVYIFRKDKLATTIRNNPDISGIAGFRISPGGLVGIQTEPCTLVDASAPGAQALPGMAIPGTGVKLVKYANLGGATPIARSTTAILQGHLDLDRLTGAVKNLVVSDLGQIVDEAGVVYGALEGISRFPTAMSSHFDFGSPLVGLSLGNGGVFVDEDGAGPGAPTLLAGIVRHFVSVESAVALPAGVTTIPLTRGAQGSLGRRIEIPGSFVSQMDPASLTLAGVAPTSIGPEVTDTDGDSDPERVLSWSQPELEGAIREQNLESGNFARLVFTGKMLDGTPIRGTVGVELR